MMASAIRNKDIATKNVPTADRGNERVTRTVSPTLPAAEITAPARLMAPPLATPASPRVPAPTSRGLRVVSSYTGVGCASNPAMSMAGIGTVRAKKSSCSPSSSAVGWVRGLVSADDAVVREPGPAVTEGDAPVTGGGAPGAAGGDATLALGQVGCAAADGDRGV